jgi:hypothetical protein
VSFRVVATHSDPEAFHVVEPTPDGRDARILATFGPPGAEGRARQYAALLGIVNTFVAVADPDVAEHWSIAGSVLRNALDTVGEAVLDSPVRADRHGLTFRHTVAGRRLRFTIAEE